MSVGCIYYTDNRLDDSMMLAVQQQILKSKLPVVSVSLQPINFGNNIVLDLAPSAITMFTQILTGIQNSKSKYIFFCEHDVLYHPSHFDFIPDRDDTYYYNTNVWRWQYPKDRLISYDGLFSLSGLCANRELLLHHYIERFRIIKEMSWEDGRDPPWARRMGYEPGKKRRRGGFLDEPTDHWQSEYPIIDIRHRGTLTPAKVNINSFKHKPTGWKEATMDEIKGWNLKEFIDL